MTILANEPIIFTYDDESEASGSSLQYDKQLLCSCRSLSNWHDCVFPFSVGLNALSPMMCTTWEFVDTKQTKMVDLMFWALLLQRTLCTFCTPTHVKFWHSRVIYQSYGNAGEEQKKLNEPCSFKNYNYSETRVHFFANSYQANYFKSKGEGPWLNIF